MADIASLGIRVDSTDVRRSNDELGKLSTTAHRAEKGAKGVGDATNKMGQEMRGALDPVGRMKMLLGGVSAALVARQVIDYADAWNNAGNMLRQVTESTEELEQVQARLLGVANETRTRFETTADLYARLARATTEMNLTQEELIGLTTTINQSFAASGATAEEASAAIVQLSQGLAAGALRGDEFNSVSEQADGIIRALSESLNMTKGELRDFAAEGGITSEIIVKALQEASDSIADDFGDTIAVFGQKMTVAKNNVTAFIGESESLQTSVDVSGDAIVWLSENAEVAGIALGSLASLYALKLVPSVAAGTKAFVAQRSLLALLGGPIGATTMVIGGLALAYTNLRDRVEDARESVMRLHTANARSMEMQIISLGQRISQTNDEINNMAEAYDRALAAGDFREVARLEAAMHTQRLEIVELKKEMLVYAGALKDAQAATEVAVQKTDEMAQSVDFATVKLLDMNEALSTNEFRMKGVQTAAGDADFRMKGVGTTAETTESSLDALGGTSYRVTDSMASDFGYLGDTAADTFADMIVNGGSAFSSLDSMFDQMLKSMASGLISSGISSIFNGGGISFGGGGGGNTASSAASFAGGASGLGSFFGGSSSIGNWVAANSGLGATPGSAAFVGPVAPGGGAGFFSQAGAFLSSPIGIALMAGVGGKIIHDMTNDPDGFHRAMGGMLVAPTTGAPDGSQFAVESFASGFSPIGFADGPTSQADARKVIEQFRFVDQALVEAVVAAGGSVNMSAATLGGFGLDGTGSGTFMGASQRTTEAQFQAQINSYARQLANHVEGLTPETMARLMGAQTVEEIVGVLTDVAEETKTDTETTKESTDELVKKNEDLERVISHLDRSSELLFNRNGDLISSNGALIASQQQIAAWMANMPAELQAAIDGYNMRAQNRADLEAQDSVPGSSRLSAPVANAGSDFAERARRERVERNKMRAQYGYSAVTGEWDDSKGGQSAFWDANRADYLAEMSGLPAVAPNNGETGGRRDADVTIELAETMSVIRDDIGKLRQIQEDWNYRGQPPER